ncbi:MAG: diacylglycerol kinase family lipid kinase [Ignavibacteriae bacterium]|nr:diacylglycerol kinase family lipid kinase [Ignavibacteriota bacterium]
MDRGRKEAVNGVWILYAEFFILTTGYIINLLHAFPHADSSVPPITLIVNPHSAKGRTARVADSVVRHCTEMGLDVTRIDTAGIGHAIDIARELNGTESVIAGLGGDGTIHEIVNGTYGGRATLALIPSGTGNDFARMIGVKNPRHGVEALAAGIESTIDLARAHIQTARGTEEQRLFVNALGIGFDAAVGYRASRMKFGSGILPYLLGVFATLRTFTPANARVLIGDYLIESTLLLACIGNGRTSGGGFRLTPHALVDDGMLDLCLVRGTPVRRILQVLPSALTGHHLSAPEVRYERVRNVEVMLDRPVPVHLDGELVAEDAVRVSVQVLPAAAQFIIGNGER